MRTSRRQLSRHHGRLRRQFSSNPDSFAFSRHLLRGANTLHFDHPSGEDRVDVRRKQGWLEDYIPPPLSAGFDDPDDWRSDQAESDVEPPHEDPGLSSLGL